MLITSTPMFVMFARAVSFFNAALKTQEKFGFQLRSVPGSCCKLSHQWTFSLHEPWVLAISVLDFKLEFHFCQNSVLVLFTKKQGLTFTFFQFASWLRKMQGLMCNSVPRLEQACEAWVASATEPEWASCERRLGKVNFAEILSIKNLSQKNWYVGFLTWRC